MAAEAPGERPAGPWPSRPLSAGCPVPVRRAAMGNNWDQLTFLHWPYPPDQVQRLLPPGLEVETFDGVAWVALVPFRMRVWWPGVPPVGHLTRFAETNVRTYAVGPDGSAGVWFLSLDAAALAPVVAGRVGYAVPYHWSAMTAEALGDLWIYTCRRRWPGPRGVSSKVAVQLGERYAPDELGDVDHWLTARWHLWATPWGGDLRITRAEHPPWPLHRAELVHLDDELVAATGLPAPTGPPVVHASPGTEVRIGWPHRLASRAGSPSPRP